MVPKKNGKIQVCIDHRKLNVVPITDAFPFHSLMGVLDAMAGHEIYNLLSVQAQLDLGRMYKPEPDRIRKQEPDRGVTQKASRGLYS